MGKIILFGATGLVGAYTAIHLKENGYDVVAVGHRKSDNGFFKENGIDYFSLDIPSFSKVLYQIIALFKSQRKK